MNTVTQEQINEILSQSEFRVGTVFDKATVLHVQLPNGFVITEHSACVDPANHDPHLGRALCEKKVVDKLWELEGYRLACETSALRDVETKEEAVRNRVKSGDLSEAEGQQQAGALGREKTLIGIDGRPLV